MKSAQCIAIAALFSSLLAACASAPHATTPGTNALNSVKALETKRLALAAASDVGGLRPLLSDKLLYCHSTGRCESGESLLRRIGSGDLKYLKIEPGEMSAEPLAGAVMIRGTINADVENAGQPLHMMLRYLAIYEKTAADWQLRAYQSTRMP